MYLVYDNRSAFCTIILLLVFAAAAAFLISPVSADPVTPEGKGVVTIAGRADQSYYLGEEVIFSGVNRDSDSTYLFITGPNLPDVGGKMYSPHQTPVSGNPGSFTTVKTKPDKTWDYIWYTSNGELGDGVYTFYAVSQPETKDRFNNGTTYGTFSIILKKPFITADITPSPVSKGQPFTVMGHARENPGAVQLWIIGDNYVYTATTPVNPDSSFMFTGDTHLSGKLPSGQCYLFVQHPMENNQFDIAWSGDWVKNLQLKDGGPDGTNLFKITGAGSLQGNDAKEALVAAFSGVNTSDDTYTIVPFQVDDAGISPAQAQPATTMPVPPQTPASLLQFAPFGALAVIMGIVVWSRR